MCDEYWFDGVGEVVGCIGCMCGGGGWFDLVVGVGVLV